MKNFVVYFLVIAIALLLQSCVLHKAYVPSGYEPVVVSDKNDKQFALTLRPLDYLNVDYTHAITNHIALRGTIGGTYQLYNGMASLIYFNKIKTLNYVIAPLLNYQNNQMIRRTYGFSGFTYQYVANYNCVFMGTGLTIGVSIPGRVQHHFMIKSQYNFVDRYNFQFYQDNASGSSYGFRVLDDEKLNKDIPSFLSIEPTYAILFKAGSKKFFKLQAGLNICEKTYAHNYSYYRDSWGTQNTDRVKRHPTNWPINLSVGFIFSSKKEIKMTEQ